MFEQDQFGDRRQYITILSHQDSNPLLIPGWHRCHNDALIADCIQYVPQKAAIKAKMTDEYAFATTNNSADLMVNVLNNERSARSFELNQHVHIGWKYDAVLHVAEIIKPACQ